VRDLLDATASVVVATGVLNLWMHAADEVSAGFAALAVTIDIDEAYDAKPVGASRIASSTASSSRPRPPRGVQTFSAQPLWVAAQKG
jgi:hypothetical protein